MDQEHAEVVKGEHNFELCRRNEILLQKKLLQHSWRKYNVNKQSKPIRRCNEGLYLKDDFVVVYAGALYPGQVTDNHNKLYKVRCRSHQHTGSGQTNMTKFGMPAEYDCINPVSSCGTFHINECLLGVGEQAIWRKTYRSAVMQVIDIILYNYQEQKSQRDPARNQTPILTFGKMQA
ncbi:hypothetical protein PR048_027932 [Dryococelus australis]|uniref:Uncharacterized protein n=1 Tax=Dryococelus australis TaxID=614101 RepID=A0ABQ9GHT9_9NEOP|nr:hypothetical protein PR048_027932 [Dryococelus australis]